MNDQHKTELLNRLVIDKQESPSPVPWWQQPLFLAPACVLLGALLTFALLPRPEAPPASTTIEPLKQGETLGAAEKPSPPLDTDQKILNASGYVTARLMATVASEVMGRILSVEVDEGMRVEAGQVLARLDATVARVNHQLAIAQHQSQLARLESTRSEWEEARRVLKRQKSLKELTSEAALTRAQADVLRLDATIKSFAAEVEVSRLAAQREQEILDDFIIRAPFAGVVTEKNAQPGEFVAPSAAGGGFTRTGICTIVDMESLEIEVDVNEAFIGRVFPGQKVVANLDAYPDWPIPAKVIAVIPTADRSKATVQVRIEILEKDPRILPDMGVKVAFYKAED